MPRPLHPIIPLHLSTYIHKTCYIEQLIIKAFGCTTHDAISNAGFNQGYTFGKCVFCVGSIQVNSPHRYPNPDQSLNSTICIMLGLGLSYNSNPLGVCVVNFN